MNPILADFFEDLSRVTKLLTLLENLSKAPAPSSDPQNTINDEINPEVAAILLTCHDAKVAFPILCGAMLLYLSGRFEYFARELFEDMCSEFSKNCKYYEKLPKELRENLVKFTALVIPDSRKYGHGDGAIKTFVHNLADNLGGKEISEINVQCLSVTNTNMRSDVLSDLFGRAGIKNLWETLGQQTALKAFFHEFAPQLVSKKAKDRLDELMQLRNKVAHPSGSFVWPAIEDIRQHVEFLKVLSSTLSEHCSLFATNVAPPV